MKKISGLVLPKLILLIAVFFTSYVKSQPGCPNVNAGATQSLPCGNNCTNLTATFLQTGQTTAYTVSSIPYAPPYAYNTGTAIMVNIDDRWSSVISLPFTFCFFGNSYNQIVVGSNGVVTFNTGVSGGFCPWSFTATCPSANLPVNAIFGVYHDIDPSISGNLYYAILGTAPCRTFVVNFNQVAMYSCTSLKATHQIVLYESTNAIEVYVLNKPLCSSWNSGNGLIGIQNNAGNLGYSPPGRNTSQWTASNEAWRFTPSGPVNYTLAWLQAGNQIGSTPTINVCPTQTTTYTAQVTYTNCNGAQVVVTDPVTVNITNPPAISVTPPNPTICMGQSQTLTASGATTYTWSPATGLSSSTGTTVTANPTTTTTYTVVGSSNGCTSSTQAVVNVAGGPTVSLPPLTPVCITASSFPLSGGTPAGGTYSGNGVSNGVFNPISAGVGTHTITYSYTDPQSCIGTATQTINVNALPQADAGNNQIVCAGQSVTFNATGGTQYLWSTGATTAVLNIIPQSTTTYTVTVTDANGCSATDNVSATVNPLPIADAGTNSAVCAGNTAQLIAGGGANYSWSPSGSLSNSLIANPVASPNTTTTYVVTVTDNNGCTATDDVVVAIYPLPVADAGNDTYVCDGITIALNATGGVNYQWSPVSGLSASNIPNPVANPTNPTTYTVTVTDVNGCSATDDVIVSVFAAPVVAFSANTHSGCNPLLVQFTDNSTPSIQTWAWNFGHTNSGSNTSTAQNPTHFYNNAGNFTVTLTATTTDGCAGTATYTHFIEVFPNPVAYFSMNPAVADVNNSHITFHCQSTLACSWNWDFGDPTSGSQNHCIFESTSHNYASDGTYTVTLMVETQNGCIDTTSRDVVIQSAFTLYIPNSFTPDGDGLNDFFQAYGENIIEYQMLIFNRWGELVYETDDYNSPWDGRYNGSANVVQQDVYIYKITIKDQNGKTHRRFGSVSLIK